MADEINQPAHYKQGGIETIDVLQAKLSPAEFSGFCIGNALKYLTRRHYKGKAHQDLEKAHWYLTRALNLQQDSPPLTAEDLKPDPDVLDVVLKRIEQGKPVDDLITQYPGQPTHNQSRELDDPSRECIQPGCPNPQRLDRLYCGDHAFSTGKTA